MRVDVNDDVQNDVVCTMLYLKTDGGGDICFSKHPATYKRGLSVDRAKRIHIYAFVDLSG